jgi:1-pyrroline-5-carboxylate dehydrogenase
MTTQLTYTSGALDSELDEAFEAALTAARAAEGEPAANVFGGHASAAGPVFEREDPSRTERVAGRAHAATPDEVAGALQAARQAYATWGRMDYRRRSALLHGVADSIRSRHLALAAAASLETGKTRTESIVEVQEAVDLVMAYAGHVEENEGYTRPLRSFVEGERNEDRLLPYGVFGVIAPFNFPVALSAGMSAAALAAGNTVVFKPSEETPGCGALLAEAFLEALPEGVFGIVHGGADVGGALVDGDVDGIAFTGSAAVGREIARKLAAGRYPRPALLEMGGKNPAVVTAHADLGKAAEGIARAAFGLSGQKCSACSRAVVEASVHDELVERLVAFTAGLVVGDPAERETFMGPVIDRSSVARFDAAVADATRDGRVLAGGGRPDLPGHFVEPTVVADLPQGHRLTREELFLPFVAVTRVASFAEAIAEANAVDYGLSAGIFTDDDGEAEEFFAAIEAGVVYRNRRAGATTGAWPGTQTFCGWKSSGFTGKGGLGTYYVPQFMREQSRTVVA